MSKPRERPSPRRAFASLLASVIVTCTGCSAITDFSKYTFDAKDAGVAEGDGGANSSRGSAGRAPDDVPKSDAGQDADPAPAGTTTFVQTSGGAVIVTPDYRLSISVGAPQPMGERTSASHRLFIGPGSAQ